ncbi:GNAT family N-acetyltransferase [Nocardioides panacisoli]|uniref:GNAT family N-acetyltransferase n=1 Tax=Nocardioides panacisoli TaxID=627624 RepID=UPI001C638BB0|nr:GNAT family N-acetyltransferase [Nocardioides panacisoli]QYJ04002.1 GNAT family N-acetyltransferase [Nocardioides panacisoli]
MIELPEPPVLTEPTVRVQTSYLVGEQADMRHRGADATWLREASRDFAAYVATRVGVQERWGVPSELFWFTSGEYYLGSLVIRHRLTEDEGGGHVGYHVVQPWQGQGHATAMLGQALPRCRDLGIDPVLLTVAPDNAASMAVVGHHDGVPDGLNHEGELRFWITP